MKVKERKKEKKGIGGENERENKERRGKNDQTVALLAALATPIDA